MKFGPIFLLSIFCLVTIGPPGVRADAPLKTATHKISLAVYYNSDISTPLTNISRNYTRTYQTAITLVPVQDEEQWLNRIKNGLAADVFITHNMPMMQRLRDEGLMDVYSQRPVGAHHDEACALLGEQMDEARRFIQYLSSGNSPTASAPVGQTTGR